jgi:uncharacterized protein YfdQ (DUF2303 family)
MQYDDIQNKPEYLVLAEQLTDLATSAIAPEVMGTYVHVVVPEGYAIKEISDRVELQQDVPNRKRGTVQLKSLQSLMDYMADMQTADSASTDAFVYANPDLRTITAVFNDNKNAGGWRDHRAVFSAEFTPEFKRWMDWNGKQMGQTEFAEFVEDNMADITEPAAAKLLDMALTIQAKTDINFSSAKRLQNGQVQLQYTEAINATAGTNGGMEIPKEFTLGLRIFKNGEGYKLRARLKYRLNAGAIKFWYELDRPERSIEDAFAGYVATLSTTSGYRVLLGTP